MRGTIRGAEYRFSDNKTGQTERNMVIERKDKGETMADTER